jgi:hypothetical protein
VIVKIKGYLAKLLLEIAPQAYGDYICVDKKGIPVILAECWNAIYGTMIAGLLYYNKLGGTLGRLGFEPNPYEPCVHNRIVNGKQQTVCFHVDDLKSSGQAKTNDALVLELRPEYEHIQEDGTGKMTVHQGKVHEYLGMTLDYSTPGVCEVSMKKYTQEMNARSSTKSELVAVDDMMPTVLWARQFLENQSYALKDNLVYQDNQATILLETNERASSGKRTKHINMWLFFNNR